MTVTFTFWGARKLTFKAQLILVRDYATLLKADVMARKDGKWNKELQDEN